jgi:hypothetical protein
MEDNCSIGTQLPFHKRPTFGENKSGFACAWTSNIFTPMSYNNEYN